MQTPNIERGAEPANPPIPLRDLTTILIKHYGYHEGFYEVGVQFNIAIGVVGPDPANVAPGAVLTVGGIGLSRCPETSLLGVDASVVNSAAIKSAKRPARAKIPK